MALTTLNVSNWNVSKTTNMTGFLYLTSMTTANYNATLINWNALALLSGVTVDFGSSKYTLGGPAATARAGIITKGWTINDGGGI